MTIPVPKLPTDYQYVPISPDQLTKATSAVPTYSKYIINTLTILAVLLLLNTLLGVAGWYWFSQSFQSLLEQYLVLIKQPSKEIPPFPTWAAFSVMILNLFSGLIPIWGIWMARRTILAVTQQVTKPNNDHIKELIQATKAITPWIVLGKWTPLITTILILPAGLTVFFVMKRATNFLQPQESYLETLIVNATFDLPNIISMLLQNIPAIIIIWLILSAIQNWLHAVVVRTQRFDFPIQPFSRSINSWFLFVLIILGILIFQYASATLIISLLPTLMSSIPNITGEEFIKIILQNSIYLIILCLFSIVVFILCFMAILWSKRFAHHVGIVLDADLPKHNPALASTDQPAEW